MENEESPPTPDPRYKVKISGEGVSIDREVGQEVALAVIAAIMGRSVAPSLRSPSGAGGRTMPLTPSAMDLSVGEFLGESKAKRNPEKITAIGTYLMKQGRDTFTRDDAKAQFPAAGEPVPANFPRDFAWAVTSRWIAEAPGHRGQFYVTKTGLEAVQKQFPEDVRKGTRQKPVRRKARRRSSEAPE